MNITERDRVAIRAALETIAISGVSHKYEPPPAGSAPMTGGDVPAVGITMGNRKLRRAARRRRDK